VFSRVLQNPVDSVVYYPLRSDISHIARAHLSLGWQVRESTRCRSLRLAWTRRHWLHVHVNRTIARAYLSEMAIEYGGIRTR